MAIPLLRLLLATSLHIILVFFLFIFMPSFLPSLFRSSNKFFSSSSDWANRMISSANLKLFSVSPLMLRPVSMFTLLNISSTADVNMTGDSVSPCRTPFMMLIFLLSFSVLICEVPPLYVSFRILMYFSSTPCCLRASNTALCWMESNTFS